MWAVLCEFVNVALMTHGRIYTLQATKGEEEVLFTASLMRFQVHI